MVVRYVIIGSGIASVSAAEGIRQRDSTGRITLISEESHDFYSRPGLAYFLRRDIPEKQLFIRSAKEILELALERIRSQALHIEVQQHQVQLENGQNVPYDRLLLATGALASPPTFSGNQLGGILKPDSLDDTHQLISRARKANRAIVVGGDYCIGISRGATCMRGESVLSAPRGSILVRRFERGRIQNCHGSTQA